MVARTQDQSERRCRNGGLFCGWVCLLLFVGGILSSMAHAGEPPADSASSLQERAIGVRSIDPFDQDFTDLERLADVLGASRVVLLGEASHGDGAAFLAKTRLVGFLHQRLGFDILVWESSFYDCMKAGQAIKAGTPWRKAVQHALLPVWSGSEQCEPLMQYVERTQKTNKPITLAGLGFYLHEDSALFGDVGSLVATLDSSLPTAEQRTAFESIKEMIRTADTATRPAKPTKPSELRRVDELIDLLKSRRDRLRQSRSDREIEFMRLALENLKSYVTSLHRPRSRGGADDNPMGAQQGRNLTFLANEYFQGHKVIVWCHNGHLARNTPRIEDKRLGFNRSVPMGQHAHKAFGEELYSVLFLAHHGRRGLWWQDPREIREPEKESWEDLLHDTQMKYCFVDFRGLPLRDWMRAKRVAHPVAYLPMRADWTAVADGLFFIDEMTPSIKSDGRP